MSLLEEKTPSKQFVMPNEVPYYVLPPCPPSFSSLALVMPCFSYTYTLSHHTYITSHHHHTHTHTHTTGWFNGGSEDARQVTGSTLTIDGGWTTR